MVQQITDAVEVRDGDGWSMHMRDRDGVELAAATWTATYRMSYPNGENCLSCTHADLRDR
ncbi:MAG: hypothetical protein M3680_13310 [Myxococcota bacterium]|nr:hypothetical protein [Myxococcota bacterium]